MMSEKLLEIKNLSKFFKVKDGLLHAVDNLSFYINKGETLGLVGESGCGKSTTGRTIVRLIDADRGEINYKGNNILQLNNTQMKNLRQQFQIVFQDPYSSLNPRLSVKEIISEPLTNFKEFKNDRNLIEKKVKDMMSVVGLEKRLENAYPHELDGGRRQRVGIARSLSVDPEMIILDEPVSALDVCIQAQILNLLKRLQNDMDLTYLFIAHDLSVVKHISDRVAVMYLGKLVELADKKELFDDPKHPYTQSLLSAIPVADPTYEKERIILEGDVPSPVDPPSGCRFHPRCPKAFDLCSVEEPEFKEYGDGHFAACHLLDK